MPRPFEYYSRPVQADYGALGFVAGEAAGEGLAAELAAGVVLLGEGAVAGAVVVAGEFEFELVVGSSAQPTAKAIARTAGSNNTVRLISFVFELLIVLPRSRKIEKRDDDCSYRDWQQ